MTPVVSAMLLAVAAALAVLLFDLLRHRGAFHTGRRRIVRCLWASDRIAARMARWLRRGNRCFSCASRMTEDEREYYGTACEACEGRDMAEGRGCHG
jgi:hypothetical protein